MNKICLMITFFFILPAWSYTAKQLEGSSKAASRAVIADTQAQQSRISQRLKILKKIDALRAEEGATNDPQRRNKLEIQVRQLQGQLQQTQKH